MAYLSIPFRISYVGKNFRTGLTDIFAIVQKPDGSTIGFFDLAEGTGVFIGTYSYNYESTVDDQQGEYMVLITSPTENNKDVLRMPLYIPPSGAAAGASGGSGYPLVGTVQAVEVTGTLASAPTIVGQFEQSGVGADTIVNNDLTGDIASDGVSGSIDNSNLEGSIYELP